MDVFNVLIVDIVNVINMYKVERFEGTPEELEVYLNKKCVTEGLYISYITNTTICDYVIVFYDHNRAKEQQILLNYVKENLCKKCLNCANLGYFCRGSKEGCDSWEEDVNAYQRLDRVV